MTTEDVEIVIKERLKDIEIMQTKCGKEDRFAYYLRGLNAAYDQCLELIEKVRNEQ